MTFSLSADVSKNPAPGTNWSRVDPKRRRAGCGIAYGGPRGIDLLISTDRCVPRPHSRQADFAFGQPATGFGPGSASDYASPKPEEKLALVS
jgi:hypothetical protein